MAMRKHFKTSRRTTYRRTMGRKIARQWSREEMAFMRKFYRNYETTWIARQLGRTVYSVRYKAVDLRLKKANPSIWRGTRGTAGAFRKPASRSHWKPARRKVAKRRTTRTKSWRASSMRKVARKSKTRRTIRRRK